jgi:hypothetical protein
MRIQVAGEHLNKFVISLIYKWDLFQFHVEIVKMLDKTFYLLYILNLISSYDNFLIFPNPILMTFWLSLN